MRQIIAPCRMPVVDICQFGDKALDCSAMTKHSIYITGEKDCAAPCSSTVVMCWICCKALNTSEQ